MFSTSKKKPCLLPPPFTPSVPQGFCSHSSVRCPSCLLLAPSPHLHSTTASMPVGSSESRGASHLSSSSLCTLGQAIVPSHREPVTISPTPTRTGFHSKAAEILLDWSGVSLAQAHFTLLRKTYSSVRFTQPPFCPLGLFGHQAHTLQLSPAQDWPQTPTAWNGKMALLSTSD